MVRDCEKYNVAGLADNLNKNELVYIIVKDYIENNKPSLESLQALFLDEIQGSKGFILNESDVKDPKCFNMKMPLSIRNGIQVVISNKLGDDDVTRFLDGVKILGYKVSKNSLKTVESTFTKEQIDIITKENSSWDFTNALKKAMHAEEAMDALLLKLFFFKRVGK